MDNHQQPLNFQCMTPNINGQTSNLNNKPFKQAKKSQSVVQKKTAKIVAIEGLNAAGKSFFTDRLKTQLTSLGYSVAVIKAPIYQVQADQIDHCGPAIFNYLNQKDKNDGSSKYTMQEIDDMFAVNRKYIQDHIISKNCNQYDFLLLDRWIMSGAVYSSYRSQIPRIRSNSNEDSLDHIYQSLIPETRISDAQKEIPRAIHGDINQLLKTNHTTGHLQDLPLEMLSSGIPEISFYSTKELVPDYTVFIDTSLEDIMCRMQSRQQFSCDSSERVSTQQQIYSNKSCFQYIRALFRHYINQHIHSQKILIVDNSFDISQPLNMILNVNSQKPSINQQQNDQDSFYTCNSRLQALFEQK